MKIQYQGLRIGSAPSAITAMRQDKSSKYQLIARKPAKNGGQ